MAACKPAVTGNRTPDPRLIELVHDPVYTSAYQARQKKVRNNKKYHLTSALKSSIDPAGEKLLKISQKSRCIEHGAP